MSNIVFLHALKYLPYLRGETYQEDIRQEVNNAIDNITQ